MQLSVIIINFNVKYFLEQCLLSVIKAMKSIEGEIIVIDNCSTDESEHFFHGKFKEVNFIWNHQNVGFAKANNQGIKIAKGEYLLILNPDTLVAEDCFEKCISFLQSHNDDGALGIKMIDGSGVFLKESKRSFPSPLTSFYKLMGLAAIFPRSKTFGKYHLGHLDNDKNHEVDVLAGAFMMIPRKIMDKVQGFDEEFFMYGEDVDLSYRIQKAGFKNYYFSESTIIHFKGESTKKGSLNYVKMFYTAMSVFVKKHYGGRRAGLFTLFIQAAIWARAGISAFSSFLKWIGLPIIDAILILISFGIVKDLWEGYLHYPLNYSPNVFLIAFPAFTLLFLAASYFSGLYDNGYKQSRLNKSALIAILVILSVYAILPKSLKFSRVILIFGSLFASLLLSLVRILLMKWKIIGRSKEDLSIQLFIVGNKTEFNKVRPILKFDKNIKRVFQRINLDEEDAEEKTEIDTLQILSSGLQLFPKKEIVFCEGRLTFKRIIELLSEVPSGMHIRFFARGSHTIIGSDNKDVSGEFISNEEAFNLSYPPYRRVKSLFDVMISLFFLITFPVHLFIKKNVWVFFKNTCTVLILKKTWVGYAVVESSLPNLKPGVITVTGFPQRMNTLFGGNLASLDKIYAKHYRVGNDLKIVLANYKFLS